MNSREKSSRSHETETRENSKEPTTLRPEAQSFKWEHLDASQRRAFERIVRALKEAVISLPARSRGPTDVQKAFFDRDEAPGNHTIWLSGERGTGKTSLLKSIARAVVRDAEWNQEIDNFEAQAASSPESGLSKNASDRRGDYERIRRDLKVLQGRVIWLDPLEMELLPGPTNLLAAILARVEAVIKRIHRSAGAESRRGMFDRRTDTDQALTELRKLMSDVSLAWDGNLPARAGHLDPDSFASETIRSECARLGIRDRYGEVLDNLARTALWENRVTDPLFVLSVDDFDLNPARCLELLRLVRLLNVHRLFTVALGNLDEAERVLHVKFTGDFAKVAEIRLHADIVSLDIHRENRTLAFEALRKLIPPAQRIYLELMSESELLEFKPYANQEALHELLSRIRIPFPMRLKDEGPNRSPTRFVETEGTLLDLLIRNPLLRPPEIVRDSLGLSPTVHDTAGTLDLRQEEFGYSFLRLFRIPTRHVSDVWHHLSAYTSASSPRYPRDRINHIVRLFKDAVRVDPDLADEQQRSLQKLFQRRLNNRGWAIDNSHPRLVLGHAHGVRESLPYRELFTESGEGTGDVWAGFELETDTERQIETTKWNPETRTFEVDRALGDVTQGLVILTHDLICLSQPGESSNSLISYTDDLLDVHPRLMSTVWRFPNKRLILWWPAPRFRSFWECDHFISAWNQANRLRRRKAVRDGLNLPDDLKLLSFWWIATGTAMVDQRGLSLLPKGEGEYWRSPKSDDWQTLVKRVEELAKCVLAYETEGSNPPPRDRFTLALTWLQSLALLLAPEMGLPVEIAKQFLPFEAKADAHSPVIKPTAIADFWMRHSFEIRQARAKLAGTFEEAKFPLLVARLFRPYQTLAESPEAISAEAALMRVVSRLREFLEICGHAAFVFRPGRVRKEERELLDRAVSELEDRSLQRPLLVDEHLVDDVLMHLLQRQWRKKTPPTKHAKLEELLIETQVDYAFAEKQINRSTPPDWHPINVLGLGLPHLHAGVQDPALSVAQSGVNSV